jgi:hypothetical protein
VQYTFVPATLGMVLMMLGWAWIVRTLTSIARIKRRFEGMYAYDKRRNELLEVTGYGFHEFACQTFKGLMLEQSGLLTDWDKDPMSDTFRHDEKTGAYQKREPAATQVLTELCEYWVLTTLAQHLQEYFSPEEYDRQGHIELQTSAIEEALMKNRFLQLLTKNWNERGSLRNVKTALKRLPQFSLLIPLMSEVRRIKDNTFEIKTPTYRLQIESICTGFTVRLPSLFVPLYLGHRQPKDVQHFQIRVKANVSFNGSALLSQGGWEDYAWVMSWLDAIEKDFSKDLFLTQIEWQRTMAVARVLHNATELHAFKNGANLDA